MPKKSLITPPTRFEMQQQQNLGLLKDIRFLQSQMGPKFTLRGRQSFLGWIAPAGKIHTKATTKRLQRYKTFLETPWHGLDDVKKYIKRSYISGKHPLWQKGDDMPFKGYYDPIDILNFDDGTPIDGVEGEAAQLIRDYNEEAKFLTDWEKKKLFNRQIEPQLAKLTQQKFLEIYNSKDKTHLQIKKMGIKKQLDFFKLGRRGRLKSKWKDNN